eukprot:m.102565 g.102565  ORF g.102565 m.102565 type:complete len:1159 (-) comp14122_c1_seq2:71-3547(-)
MANQPCGLSLSARKRLAQVLGTPLHIQSSFSLPTVVLDPLAFIRSVANKANERAFRIQNVRLEGPFAAQCAVDSCYPDVPLQAMRILPQNVLRVSLSYTSDKGMNKPPSVVSRDVVYESLWNQFLPTLRAQFADSPEHAVLSYIHHHSLSELTGHGGEDWDQYTLSEGIQGMSLSIKFILCSSRPYCFSIDSFYVDITPLVFGPQEPADDATLHSALHTLEHYYKVKAPSLEGAPPGLNAGRRKRPAPSPLAEPVPSLSSPSPASSDPSPHGQGAKSDTDTGVDGVSRSSPAAHRLKQVKQEDGVQQVGSQPEQQQEQQQGQQQEHQQQSDQQQPDQQQQQQPDQQQEIQQPQQQELPQPSSEPLPRPSSPPAAPAPQQQPSSQQHLGASERQHNTFTPSLVHKPKEGLLSVGSALVAVIPHLHFESAASLENMLTFCALRSFFGNVAVVVTHLCNRVLVMHGPTDPTNMYAGGLFEYCKYLSEGFKVQLDPSAQMTAEQAMCTRFLFDFPLGANHPHSQLTMQVHALNNFLYDNFPLTRAASITTDAFGTINFVRTLLDTIRRSGAVANLADLDAMLVSSIAAHGTYAAIQARLTPPSRPTTPMVVCSPKRVSPRGPSPLGASPMLHLAALQQRITPERFLERITPGPTMAVVPEESDYAAGLRSPYRAIRQQRPKPTSRSHRASTRNTPTSPLLRSSEQPTASERSSAKLVENVSDEAPAAAATATTTTSVATNEHAAQQDVGESASAVTSTKSVGSVSDDDFADANSEVDGAAPPPATAVPSIVVEPPTADPTQFLPKEGSEGGAISPKVLRSQASRAAEVDDLMATSRPGSLLIELYNDALVQTMNLTRRGAAPASSILTFEIQERHKENEDLARQLAALQTAAAAAAAAATAGGMTSASAIVTPMELAPPMPMGAAITASVAASSNASGVVPAPAPEPLTPTDAHADRRSSGCFTAESALSPSRVTAGRAPAPAPSAADAAPPSATTAPPPPAAAAVPGALDSQENGENGKQRGGSNPNNTQRTLVAPDKSSSTRGGGKTKGPARGEAASSKPAAKSRSFVVDADADAAFLPPAPAPAPAAAAAPPPAAATDTANPNPNDNVLLVQTLTPPRRNANTAHESPSPSLWTRLTIGTAVAVAAVASAVLSYSNSTH